MGDLLDNVLTAHGGLDRWRRFSSLEAQLDVSNALFSDRASVPVRLTLGEGARVAAASVQVGADDRAAGRDEVMLAERPRVASDLTAERVSSATLTADWPADRRAYVEALSLRTSLTLPFVLAEPDVTLAELEPLNEQGETWRTLRVSLPSALNGPRRFHDLFFGEDFLLRRHDYCIDASGRFKATQYVDAYVETQGVRLPSLRRTYARRAHGKARGGALLAVVETRALHFS